MITEKVAHEEIDGITYTSTKLAASVGLDVLPKLVALVGEDLVKIGAMGKLEDVLGRPDVIAALIANIAERAVSSDLHGIVRQLFSRLKANRLRTVGGADGGPVLPAFDEHFSGEYMHLFRVIAFVVKHNFAGFTLGARSPLSSEAPQPAPTAG